MKSLALAKGLTIRKACEEDKETISQLVNQAFTGYNNGKNISHLKENLEDILRDIKKDEVIVLEGKNKIIGTLRLEYRDENKYYLKKLGFNCLKVEKSMGYSRGLLIKELK